MNVTRTPKMPCSIVYLLSREVRRFITYYDIINIHNRSHVENDMLELKNAARAKGKEFKTKILTKLARLEEEILRVKGKKREETIKTYRKLLRLLKEEPIYLLRYE